MKKIVILAFAALALMTSFTGCRTAQGAGEDIEEVGQKAQQETAP
jgi:predicted small secreted protein